MSARPTVTIPPLTPDLAVRQVRGRTGARRLSTAAGAGIVALLHKRPDLRTYGYGVDVYPTSIAEAVDTAIRWNA